MTARFIYVDFFRIRDMLSHVQLRFGYYGFSQANYCCQNCVKSGIISDGQ